MALVEVKSVRDIAKMRKAGKIVATVLKELMAMSQPGVTTADLDAHAERQCANFGVIPAFKGYYGFPACLCTSLNNEVVHGIPNARRKLKGGDILKIDFGVIYDGWHGDSCVTVGIGDLNEEAQSLIAVTEAALYEGIAQVRHGVRLQQISGAIQDYVERHGFSVVRQYVGHGVGRKLHEEPRIPHFRTAEIPNPQLEAGMTIAIEPMVNIGHCATRTLADRWTVVTIDHSLSAEFEHTVLVTQDGYEILTDRAVTTGVSLD
jgi:methionyl aminopeptidase